METYEGKCKGCGLIQSVLADSQADADQRVTDQCDCSESERVIWHQQMIDNIEEMIGHSCTQYGFIPVEEGTAATIKEVAELIFDEKIGKGTFVVDGTTITLIATEKSVKINRKKIKSVTLGG